MAFSTKEFFADRPALRTSASTLASSLGREHVLRSPKTPALGRSVSNFGSPGPYRVENDDNIIYELGCRYLSAGFAGESRPRCRLPFTPDNDRRIGDYRHFDIDYISASRNFRLAQQWADGYELFNAHLNHTDLGLMEERLAAVLRAVHGDFLQLDAKPRKATLIVPSLIPTPVLEMALRVIFSHFTQPPTITVLTTPALACVAAGVRDGLVVDIGWNETVVTAIGELKDVHQRRSIKAMKHLSKEFLQTMQAATPPGLDSQGPRPCFNEVEEFMHRMAWCNPRDQSIDSTYSEHQVDLAIPGASDISQIPFTALSESVERAFFIPNSNVQDCDDHDLPLHILVYRTLLTLPVDLRSLCVSRIVIIGEGGEIPGLRRRILQELSALVEVRGWNSVHNFGSIKSHRRPLATKSSNTIDLDKISNLAVQDDIALSPSKMPLQENLPHAHRVHDDIRDPVTLKAEREAAKGKAETVKTTIRGVHSLGAWAGASLLTSMRVKGAHEFDRDDFIKHGLRESSVLWI